jgi:CrcB protein
MWLSIFLQYFSALALVPCFRAGFNILAVGIASAIPLGTLLSNLVGGYLVGFGSGLFWQQSTVITRVEVTRCDWLLRGLQPSLAYSAEVVGFIQTWRIYLGLRHSDATPCSAL